MLACKSLSLFFYLKVKRGHRIAKRFRGLLIARGVFKKDI